MCFDPVTAAIVGSALFAGGSAANYVGNQKAERAQKSAYSAEKRRQDDLTAQQDALFQNSLDRTGGVASQEGQDEAAAARKAAFVEALGGKSPDQGFLPGSSTADAAVGENANRVVATQDAFSDQQAGALAKLTGFGDQMLDANILNARDAGAVNQLSTSKRASAGVLDAELQAAARKGGTLRGLGSLATQLGTMALTAGLGGMPAAGAGGGATSLASGGTSAFAAKAPMLSLGKYGAFT